jgi:hypothetical protein
MGAIMPRMARLGPVFSLTIAVLLAACGGDSPTLGDQGTGIAGRVVAGPVCPVERPDDPACAPRPVAGALVIVRGADGSEVATARTTDDGRYEVFLPPGRYTLETAPVQGLMGNPAAVEVEVGNGLETVDLQYDTGIR